MMISLSLTRNLPAFPMCAVLPHEAHPCGNFTCYTPSPPPCTTPHLAPTTSAALLRVVSAPRTATRALSATAAHLPRLDERQR